MKKIFALFFLVICQMSIILLSGCGENKRSNEEIVLITISENDINNLGSWPIDRSLYGKLIDKIYAKHKPSVFYFDLAFEDYTKKERDSVFFKSIIGKKNVVFPAILSQKNNYESSYNKFSLNNLKIRDGYDVLESKSCIFPLKELSTNGAVFGIRNYLSTDMGFLGCPPVWRINSDMFESVPLKILMLHEKINQNEVSIGDEYVQCGNKKLKYGQQQFFDIKTPFTFREISIQDILSDNVSKGLFDEKIVMLVSKQKTYLKKIKTLTGLEIEEYKLLPCVTQSLLKKYKNDVVRSKSNK